MRYEVNESNFEIYFWDDVNAEPYQYQPNYPNGDFFDSVEEATAWAEASIAAHSLESEFYAPLGKNIEPQKKVRSEEKEYLINSLNLTEEQKRILNF